MSNSRDAFEKWINAAVMVANAESMADEEVIPTWPVFCVERSPELYPELTVGAVRAWQASRQALEAVDVERIADTVRDHLGDIFACTRVWEAWQVGTMTQNDFTPADETELADDIAGAVATLYAHPVRADDLIEPVAGEMVSIDVSTCDEDNGNRVFGEIVGWQDDGDGKRIWLCSLDHFNYTHPASESKGRIEGDKSGYGRIADSKAVSVPEGWIMKRAAKNRITIECEGVGFYVAGAEAQSVSGVMLYALADALMQYE